MIFRNCTELKLERSFLASTSCSLAASSKKSLSLEWAITTDIDENIQEFIIRKRFV